MTKHHVKSFLTVALFLVFFWAVADAVSSDNFHHSGPLTGEEPESVTDSQGHVYMTVKIGNQVWMAENLKTTTYNDGFSIKNVTDDWEWGKVDGNYCWYDNDITYKEDYGAIYNWQAVETGNLCPAEWHVPSREEYLTLIEYVGGIAIGGGILKEKGTSHWASPNIGATNEFCLTALPGGYRKAFGIGTWDDDMSFNGMGEHGVWLTSTIEPGGTFYYVGISNNYQDAGMEQSSGWANGASVRCIKDE